jgi:1,4-dihydroxy-2-naphthoate octaprenyltransferase
MKRLTYYLNQQFQEGETVFPAWTVIQPIDNVLLPEHMKEKLQDAQKYRRETFVMCIIGTKWYAINKDHITERR